jgi:hypothetical protein
MEGTLVKSQDIIDSVIHSLIVTCSPVAVGVALNNACCHGEALIEHGGCELDDEDEILGQLFDGIDTFLRAAKKMEGR